MSVVAQAAGWFVSVNSIPMVVRVMATTLLAPRRASSPANGDAVCRTWTMVGAALGLVFALSGGEQIYRGSEAGKQKRTGCHYRHHTENHEMHTDDERLSDIVPNHRVRVWNWPIKR